MRIGSFALGRTLAASIVAFAMLIAVTSQAEAQTHKAGYYYNINYPVPFHNVYTRAAIDVVRVQTAGTGTASGYVQIWNANGKCAYVQFKPTPGAVWHNRTEKVCSKRLNRWVELPWRDDFFFYTGGSYSFRTCISDSLRDTCGRGIYIQIPQS